MIVYKLDEWIRKVVKALYGTLMPDMKEVVRTIDKTKKKRFK